MENPRLLLSIPLIGLALLTGACESAEKKNTAAHPPQQATAPTITAAAPAVAAPAKPVEPTPQQPDAVEELINRAEQQYRQGQANYAAGHLESAKADFDKAFDTLLQGPIEVHADERLEREFDKIVEAVNSLEMVALKQGDGFTEQRSEPAPIDEANEVTFPVDPEVKAKAEAELASTRSDLPLMINDQVASFINYFSTKGHGTIEHSMIRAGRYREMINRIFKEEGVPQDLIYLAEAESGFHPVALSHAGARGMWQFMASRASGYGLQRNWWVDDRQDPEKATRAAARHLKDLYNQFGDWYLAMAAYNSGPGTVQHAVQRTGYADFWELYRRNVLPGETRNYVPIILAFAIMAKNPAQYGLDRLTPDPPMKSDNVKIDYPVDLRLVAEIVDSTVVDLQELNPSLLRMTTPKDGEFTLRLPVGTASRFEQAIASIPQDKRVWWRYHRVTGGETLGEIAKKYHSSTSAIADVNNLEDGAELKKDARLIIPVQPGRSGDAQTAHYSKHPVRYKVRKGDTVLSVADDYGVPADKIRRWNHLRGNSLTAGRSILIYRALADSAEPTVASTRSSKKSTKSKKSAPPEDEEVTASRSKSESKSKKSNSLQAAKKQTHKVKKGETLTSIAEHYGTTVEALKKDNRSIAKNLKAGQVLVISK
jgi:membrane-bound lytic murein transglycosylase D